VIQSASEELININEVFAVRTWETSELVGGLLTRGQVSGETTATSSIPILCPSIRFRIGEELRPENGRRSPQGNHRTWIRREEGSVGDHRKGDNIDEAAATNWGGTFDASTG
jgi:hypothetical protein